MNLEPQYICMTCKTVIGPIWDDEENQCNCTGAYDFEVWRVCSTSEVENTLDWAKQRMAAETAERPDVNIYKRTLICTWSQIIRHVQGRLDAWRVKRPLNKAHEIDTDK